MRTSHWLVTLLLAAGLSVSCNQKKDDTRPTSEQPAAAPVPEQPDVKPPPATTGTIIEQDLTFVTWNDEIRDDEETNPQVIEVKGPTELRLRYNFRVSNPKFLKVLMVRPRLSCKGADASGITLTLIEDYKETEPLEMHSMIKVEPGIEYSIEVHQTLNCEKTSGIAEIVVWTGRHDNIDPVVAQMCQNNFNEPVTFFGGDRAVMFIGTRSKFVSPKTYCGRAVEPPVEPVCAMSRDGSNEIYDCSAQVGEERSAFRVQMDPLAATGSLACMLNDAVEQQMTFSGCTAKVVDKLDYPSAF